MKPIKRILLGIISSLLLAAGFVRAAGELDPMTANLTADSNGEQVALAAEACTNNCDFSDSR